MRIAEWIVRNLNEYGNSLVPNNLFKLYSLESVEKEIQSKVDYEIFIEKRMVEEADYNFNPRRRKKTKKDTLYICWRVNKYTEFLESCNARKVNTWKKKKSK